MLETSREELELMEGGGCEKVNYLEKKTNSEGV